jgi:RNA polymerase sigma-70 factor (ECF subfamily)
MLRPLPLLEEPTVRSPSPYDEVEAAFRRYSGYVAALALRLLGRRDDVDDVVQEVFLVALEGLARMRDPIAIQAWLGTVTARRVAHRLRTRRLRSFFGLERAGERVELTVNASQEQRALVRRIYDALDRMPIALRIAWTLRTVQGERLDAVATTCGCSLATAKRRIAAAQARIDTLVSDE